MPIWRAARRERGEGGGGGAGAAGRTPLANTFVCHEAEWVTLTASRAGGTGVALKMRGERERERGGAKWRRISRTCCSIHRIHGEDGWMEEWIAGRGNGSSSAMTEMRDGGGRRRRIAEQIARPSAEERASADLSRTEAKMFTVLSSFPVS